MVSGFSFCLHFPIWCKSKIHCFLDIENNIPICYNQLTDKLEFVEQ